MTLLPLLLSVAAWAAPAPEFFADIDQFRARSLVLRTEQQRLSAEGKTTLARLFAFTPSLSTALGKYRDKTAGAPICLEAPSLCSTSYNYWRAQADWNLFHGGSDIFAWSAQRRNEEAQSLQLRNQELQVELDGAKLVFRRLYLHDVLEAEAELLRLKEQSLKIGRDRYAKGRIPLQDVAKMEVDLAQQRNVLRQSELDIAENEAAYKALFVDGLVTKSWPLPEGQELALSGAPGSLATMQLESKAAAMENSWNSSRAKWLPSLDFSLAYKKYPLEKVDGRSTTNWTGTLELSIPIWNRFETASENAQAYAGFVAAEDEAATSRRNEALQRELLQRKISLSLASLVESRKILEKSARLYQDELHSFQLGRLSTNDLFQEQQRKIQNLLSYAQSRLSYHQSLMEACSLWGVAARSCLR